MTELDDLIKHLSMLPSVGPKSASRIAFFLVGSQKGFNESLSRLIGEIKEKVFPCPICGSYSETSPCPICSDPGRDQSLLCIVEQPQDVLTIQSIGAYNGLFHVLGGTLNPLEGIGADKLSIRSLVERVEKGSFKEIIFATNPTEEGDTTALYIKRLLERKGDFIFSRLASGIPIGGDLGFASRNTLMRSLRGRTTF